MCGVNAYLSLPTGWTGRCASIIPSDHSFILTSSIQEIAKRRTKRSQFPKHDSIWGADVPSDHKLWSDGQKVALILFPWLGVGKITLRLETLDYRFGGVKEELTALRMMELQDLKVLDQVTTASGVCASCTFVPDNDADDGVIQEAIANLTALRMAIDGDHVNKGSLFSWLTLALGFISLQRFLCLFWCCSCCLFCSPLVFPVSLCYSGSW